MPARLTIGTAELETFLAIAELGSFSRAAERLSLSQPSISNRIQRLERAFQTRLFDRTTRAVVLTAAGERLRDRVEPFIGSLQAVIAEFHAEADIRRQVIAVATTPGLATLVMPPIIRRFEQAYPSVTIDLQDHTTGLGAQIRSGQIDMALVARQPPMEGVEFDAVSTNSFMVVGPRGHEAVASGVTSPQDLIRHPFLLLTAYMYCIDALSAHLQRDPSTLRPVRAAKNVSTLLGFVAEGLGLTILPELILQVGGAVDDSRFQIATLQGLRLTRDYGVLSLAGQDWRSPPARAFAAALKAELRELPGPKRSDSRSSPSVRLAKPGA